MYRCDYSEVAFTGGEDSDRLIIRTRLEDPKRVVGASSDQPLAVACIG